MAERILVRGELSNWVHVGRVVGALAFFAGLVLGGAVAWWGWIVTMGGGVTWLCLEAVAWRARRVRTWLTLHADGIEVESRAGHRPIHDSQVAAAALETKKNLRNGEVASVRRKFTLWAEDQPQPVRMENIIKVGAVDPLAGLINRLLDKLRESFAVAIAKGGTVSGDGWHLSRTALTLGRPPQDEQLPLSEITAIDLFDGQMCIWRRGNDAAVARLAPSGRNVYLLPALVEPYLRQQAEDLGGAESASGLGRVLFERRPQLALVFVVGVVGMLMGTIGLTLLVKLWGQQNVDAGAVVAEIILLMLGPLLSLLSVWLAYQKFRCHERGVWQGSLVGYKTLRYEDVGSFKYEATRHYHNGVYTGTHLTMRFRPLSLDRGAPIKFGTTTRGDDDDLDQLRDVISRAIAARMAEQFRAGKAVPWTANLEFLPEGLRYREGGWLSGRKEPQVLKYEEYGGHNLNRGMFYLFARGNAKCVFTEYCSADNFYPGFFLLLTLLHQREEEHSRA